MTNLSSGGGNLSTFHSSFHFLKQLKPSSLFFLPNRAAHAARFQAKEDGGSLKGAMALLEKAHRCRHSRRPETRRNPDRCGRRLRRKTDGLRARTISSSGAMAVVKVCHGEAQKHRPSLFRYLRFLIIFGCLPVFEYQSKQRFCFKDIPYAFGDWQLCGSFVPLQSRIFRPLCRCFSHLLEALPALPGT